MRIDKDFKAQFMSLLALLSFLGEEGNFVSASLALAHQGPTYLRSDAAAIVYRAFV